MLSFKNVLRPALGFSKVLGMYAYGESGRLKKFLRLYSITMMSSYFLFHTICYLKEIILFVDIFLRSWFQTSALIVPLFSSTSVLGPLYFLIFDPDKPMRTHQRLESLTYHLGSDGYSGLATGGLLLGAFGHYLFLYWGLDGSLKEFNEYYIMQFFIEGTISIIIASQFCVLLDVSLCQYRKLNQLTDVTSDLEKCVEIHSELCTVVSEMCEVYALPVFVVTLDFVNSVYMIAEDSWIIARHFTFNYKDHYADYIGNVMYEFHALDVGQFLLRAAFFWILCHIACEIAYESDVFGDYLCRAMRSWHYPCYNKKLLAYVATRPSVNIRVWDLFPLDNSLLPSCFALGVAMFLVKHQFRKEISDDGELYGYEGD